MIELHIGLPEEEYHASEGLSASGIGDILESPTTYWFKSVLNPLREPINSDAMDMGRMLHCLFLEGEDEFNRRYTVIPDYLEGKKKNTVAYRNWRGDDEGEVITAIQKARILAHKGYVDKWISPHIFKDGLPEVSIFWEDRGIKRKCRIDYLKIGGIVDLKTFAKVNKESIDDHIRSYILRYNIHNQLRYYKMAIDFIYENLDKLKIINHCGPEELAFIEKFISKKPDEITMSVMFVDKVFPNSRFRIFNNCNVLMREAENNIYEAERLFLEYEAKFGLKNAWLDEDQPRYFEDTDFPSLMFAGGGNESS